MSARIASDKSRSLCEGVTPGKLTWKSGHCPGPNYTSIFSTRWIAIGAKHEEETLITVLHRHKRKKTQSDNLYPRLKWKVTDKHTRICRFGGMVDRKKCTCDNRLQNVGLQSREGEREGKGEEKSPHSCPGNLSRAAQGELPPSSRGARNRKGRPCPACGGFGLISLLKTL